MHLEFAREAANPTLVDTNQAKELQELRKMVAGSTSKGICQLCKSSGTTGENLSPILSPASSSDESYFSIGEDGTLSDQPYDWREDERNQGGRSDNLGESYTSDEDEIQNNSTIPGNTSLSLQSNLSPVAQPEADYTWKVEFNPDTKVALKLNLVHTLTQNAIRTYAAFSMDGKYLATVSETGVVSIFDVKTGKRLW